MTRFVYALLALAGGSLLAMQAPINARLRVVLDSPLGSAVVSFVVGLVLLVVALLVVGDGPRLRGVGGGPWWAYLGGFCGAVFVVVALLAAPRVGVTTLFVAVVLGQVVMAALIDRFGWFGVRQIGITWERGLAIVLLLASVGLLLRR